MTDLSRKALFWAPRVLAVAYIAFLSSFALDIFGKGYNLRGAVVAITIHLMPALAFFVALLLAWRWEWIGAAFYATAGMLYVIFLLQNPIPPLAKLSWMVTVAGPAFVVAALFLAAWVRRRRVPLTVPKSAL